MSPRWWILISTCLVVGCTDDLSKDLDGSVLRDAGEGPRDAGPRDAGPRDGGIVADAGEVDAGSPHDGGLRDGGPRDGGAPSCMGPPIIEVSPMTMMSFVASPSSEILTIRNVGCDPLHLTEIDILGPGNDPNHPSVDDFRLPACSPLPCVPNRTLCGAEDPGCADSSTTFFVAYDNNDVSMTDLANLLVSSDDVSNPLWTVVLSGSSNPCLPPTASITVVTANPTAGVPVSLDAAGSSPGGVVGGSSIIVDYQWTNVFSPAGSQPVFTPQGVSTTMFTPTSNGSYFVGLVVTNDCGASSTMATETVMVR